MTKIAGAFENTWLLAHWLFAWSLNKSHPLLALFMMLHLLPTPREFPPTMSWCLNADAAQGSAGRKGSAAWRCECYRCRADTEKVGCPSVYWAVGSAVIDSSQRTTRNSLTGLTLRWGRNNNQFHLHRMQSPIWLFCEYLQFLTL